MNFASSPASRRVAIVILAIGVAGSVGAIRQRHRLLLRRDAATARVESRNQSIEQAAPAFDALAKSGAIEEAEKLAIAFQRPWEPMLDALQAAVAADVLVTRVQPETDGLRLRVAGEADSGEAFVEFVQRLRNDAAWRVADPVSEVRTAEPSSSARPVVFQLTLEWARS